MAEAQALRPELHRGAHRAGARAARRGDLRRGDGAADLARHPGAGPAAPRPGPTGLAGHGCADRDRLDHRPPARPDRRPRHRRRARRRGLHRAGWWATCCTGRPRRRRWRPWRSRRASTCARCSAYSDSANDLPMLPMVGHPCAINPDARLRAHAKRAGLARLRLPDRSQGGPRWACWRAPSQAGSTGAVAAGLAVRGRRNLGPETPLTQQFGCSGAPSHPRGLGHFVRQSVPTTTRSRLPWEMLTWYQGGIRQ